MLSSGHCIRDRCVQLPPPVMADIVSSVEDILSCTARRTFDEWRCRYGTWKRAVFECEDIPTPTQQQAQVLQKLHARVVTEEYG